MPNNQFINLEELDITTQALLSKINEQANLKVNKTNVSAEYTEGTKIAEIEDVEIYAPIQEIDTSNFAIQSDLSEVAYSGSYNDLNNTPNLSNYMVKGTDYVTAGRLSNSTVGTRATVEGYNNTASGIYSHAEGYSTTASATGAHAEGDSTIAIGNYSHAEGANTTASGGYSHSEGVNTIASGHYSHAEGQSTSATGQAAHAEGKSTIASATGAHAEGTNTTASATGAHAEGVQTTASGMYSHAEGFSTIASATSAHAEGAATTASGQYSHAEGGSTIASGQHSHAEGRQTIAQRQSQHVFGEYNIADTSGTTISRGTYVEIVGKGTSTTRSNARTLDWSGNEWLAGKLTVSTGPSADMDVTTKQYVDGAIVTAIGNVNQFSVDIVSGDLPTTGINANTIYFKSNSTTGNNVYDEYMYINSNWELIGSTAIDLTPYALIADIPVAEDEEDVEDMLDGFLLDYTTTPGASLNMWQGGNY